MRIGFGTDGGSPWAAHLEMEDMAAAGKSADFIVLDANPLDDITNTRRISAVHLRGVEVDREAVSARLLGPAMQ